MFTDEAFDAHEAVHYFHDAETGLRAIIAIHSTTLGPSAGGCRMWDYTTEAEMTRDALRLSQGMSYKNAMAGLPLGGGKGVIWGNARTDKTPELFEAFGRAIESVGGRYWSAEDVGVSPDDMRHARKHTRYVAGLDDGDAASGDPSPVTAKGVFEGIRACAARALGSDDLTDKRIAVQGVGHVGGYLCDHLHAAGAHLVISDMNDALLEAVASKTGAEIVSPDDIYDQDIDVFSPNALGAIINEATVERLNCKVIAGGANNQLIIPQMGELLRRRGILYAPDYVINGGGIINVASEISGHYDANWVSQKVSELVETLGDVLDTALSKGIATNAIADEMARNRIGRA